MASDYTFTQIVERLRQAGFDGKEISINIALRTENDPANDKKES